MKGEDSKLRHDMGIGERSMTGTGARVDHEEHRLSAEEFLRAVSELRAEATGRIPVAAGVSELEAERVYFLGRTNGRLKQLMELIAHARAR